MGPAPAALSAGVRAVTTTDVLKSAALLFVFVDHAGYYVFEDETWWRVFGRLAAPVFFFLIGFARTRSVPWTWLAFGALITALDAVGPDGVFAAKLNILLSFALIRWALPAIERTVLRSRAGLIAMVAACLLLAPLAGGVLEYGTQGWLFALLGLLHRLGLEAAATDTPRRGATVAVAAVAGSVYVLGEAISQGFGRVETAVLAALVTALVIGLLTFRRAELAQTPPEPLAAILRFGGRWSLELYAFHLILLEVWTLVR